MIFILAAERNPARSSTGFEPVASTFTGTAFSASNLVIKPLGQTFFFQSKQ